VPADTPTNVDQTLRVLAISGSLRSASSNGTILRAAALLAPPNIQVDVFRGLAELPHFNPDLDRELDDPFLPSAVRALRSDVASAHALVISTPEYAHGVPGSLKNMLDWLVGGTEMVGKPVALWNAAPHATFAHASLAETLRTMSTLFVDEAGLSLSLGGRTDAEKVATDPLIGARIVAALETLRRAALR
jgi:chromate reductase, NAD(P)H dehydrogenase (quinone)